MDNTQSNHGPKTMVRLENVTANYYTTLNETRALEHISLDVKDGEFVALIGPSGCGKSTILSLIAGLIKPTEGSVYLDRQEVAGPRVDVGYMLQQDHLFPWRTIEENALLGLQVQHLMTDQRRESVMRLLDTYGLKNFRRSYPAHLSGGMRQRVALIRTLAIDPKILLLDEPFSALDYQTRLAVAEEIRGIIRDTQKTTVLVTHDISEAVSMADRIILLTRRPAHVKREYVLELSVEEDTPMKRRNAPEFKTYFDSIWRELDVHVEA